MSNKQQKPRGMHEGGNRKGGINPRPTTPKPDKAPPAQK